MVASCCVACAIRVDEMIIEVSRIAKKEMIRLGRASPTLNSVTNLNFGFIEVREST